jgi:isopenicillin N synthase-like dioxygenase
MEAYVPVVDLSGWFRDDPSARTGVARELDRAFRDVGFVQVVGHGVPSSVRVGAFDAMDRFFARPEDLKRRAVPSDPEIYRGYSARLSESFSYSTATARPPDLVEAYVLGADDVGGQADSGPHATNVWPGDLPGFRDDVWSYYRAARSLSEQLCRIAALALGVDDHFFDAALHAANVTMRCNWYHRRSDERDLADGQMALGAHTDYGILTVLAADAMPGLQVVDAAGRWRDVLPLADGFIINVGDATAVWTNDEWRSTIHRVLPSATPGGQVRRSIALFQDGNIDTVMECLPTCRSADRPAKYAPITLGHHVQEKIRAGRTSTVVDVQQTTGERLGGDAAN